MKLPDWKDNDFYAGLKKCFPHGIAWEFWRLNHEYQKEYEEWVTLREGLKKYKSANGWIYQNVPQNFLEQDERTAQIETKWLRRRGNLPDYKKTYAEINDLQTLFHFVKVSKDDNSQTQKEFLDMFPEMIGNRNDFEKILDFDSSPDPDHVKVSQPYFVCAFRHDFPADKQIKNLRKIFQQHGKQHVRDRASENLLIFCLRVHHATKASAGIKEIGETLLEGFVGTEDERKKIERARKKAPTYIKNYLTIVQRREV